MSLRELPPRRTLPDDVRDRLRAEVRRGIAKPRRTRHVWYAAAAAVLVLAAGAVVATQVIRWQPVAGPGRGPEVFNPLSLDVRVATSSLDRCWAAVQAAGKADRVPPRAEWVPLFTTVLHADSVVAATAAGKPIFCETTEATVTLSDPAATPAYAPGTRTGLLLHSATGMAGGVLAPDGDGLFLGSRTEDGENQSQAIYSSPVTRQFVGVTRSDPARTTLTLGRPMQPGEETLPAAPPPLLSVVDRPVTADRTSPAGRALGDCLAAAELEAIPDAAAYEPGPLLETDVYRVVLGRRGDRLVVCTTEPDYGRPGKPRVRAIASGPSPEKPPAYPLIVDTLGRQPGAPPATDRRPFAAALPATAATAVIDFGGGASTEAQVVAGMVVVWVPENTKLSPETNVHVTARDAKGAVVYDGSLPMI
ncbi:hypothetical protein [Amycolatopsis sp. CA-128772]|uniref:hypothetical protein n=1 Tax=Amycolatopsis sp. CA-128772 TaxID=2073159 RepID=UPI000CD08FA8|nr:hypothetical protein [Amycolatopsis sp. CA-128772]